MVVPDGVLALEEGRAFVDLSEWRTVAVTGSDAAAWLHDLVTNRVDDLPEGVVRRTLFLDRTGRVRADVSMTRGLGGEGIVLVQDPVQAAPVDRLLQPYLLSSDVRLEDRTGDLGVVVLPDGGGPRAVIRLDGAAAEPGAAGRRGQVRRLAGEDLVEATITDHELARIRAGEPRFWVDFGEDFLPAEAGLEDLIDATKGCFLGQESVARVRNLGHPPRLVVALQAQRRVYPMAEIVADSERVGRVTSVAPLDDGEGSACIGWIRWGARDADLATDAGVALGVRARSGDAA